MLINATIRNHLEWWGYKERFIQGVTLKSSLPTHSLFTDASLEGLLFHGVWSQDQSVLNINILEMKALLLALKQCQQNVSNSKVMIATDKSSVSEEGRVYPLSVSLHGKIGDPSVMRSEKHKSSSETCTRKIQHIGRQAKSSVQTNFRIRIRNFICDTSNHTHPPKSVIWEVSP